MTRLKLSLGPSYEYLPLIIVVIVAYFTLFASSPGVFTLTRTLILIVAGIVFLVAGVAGPEICNRIGTPLVELGYFAFQIPLAMGIMFFSESRGGTWLLPLPLVAQSVPMLPRRWMLVVCSSIVAAFGLVVYVDTAGNWQTVTEASFLYLPAVVFVVVFMQVVVREQNARAEIERLLAELGQANHKLGEYAAQVEELATIKERNRLAREIHDTIGHYLTVVNVQLEAAQTIFDSDPRHALEAVRKAKSLVQEGLSEVRRSVAALRASALDERSLREAMAALVEEIRVAGLISEFTIRGETRPLRSQEKLTLYRVAQEGLTNVRKHAHATRVDLTLDYESVSEVRLVVKDNGVGSAAADGGFGLLGLRERVRLLNGQLQVTTASGQGFTLEVALPG